MDRRGCASSTVQIFLQLMVMVHAPVTIYVSNYFFLIRFSNVFPFNIVSFCIYFLN